MRGGTRGTEGQLFHRVSNAGCAGQERGVGVGVGMWVGVGLLHRAGLRAGMGPSSRKSIGFQERHTVGTFFLSLFPPSRG